MSYDQTSRKNDNVDRGNKDRNPAGTAIFVAARLLEPGLQYALLKNDIGRPLIRLLRGSTLPPGPPLLTRTIFDHLGLSPYRSILLGMSLGAMVKQNYHMTMIQQENMPPATGLVIGAFNAVLNSLNSLFFVCAQTSASANGEHFPQTPLMVGSTLYISGIVIEWLSEQQRHAFKRNPQNKGVIYEGGLFGLARHINYFGYTLWRTGYAVAAGGWLWGAVVGSFFVWSFAQGAIPAQQHYLEERYGPQFDHYKRVTPYKLIPWVY
ncbi:hypothetical protein D0860_03477 [Lecanosticta acicola]|uniref:Steroid 5-alpha reductase C-terminal domain-containing protein n=1 Tax=Lecanosticta acicola TaxID=111012 RepID=A0AAI8YT28_9PEZI|nr:hypothetical protein D0860_03477 [Lecanosticta acicola]